jgi:hypothetical protein
MTMMSTILYNIGLCLRRQLVSSLYGMGTRTRNTNKPHYSVKYSVLLTLNLSKKRANRQEVPPQHMISRLLVKIAVGEKNTDMPTHFYCSPLFQQQATTFQSCSYSKGSKKLIIIVLKCNLPTLKGKEAFKLFIAVPAKQARTRTRPSCWFQRS